MTTTITDQAVATIKGAMDDHFQGVILPMIEAGEIVVYHDPNLCAPNTLHLEREGTLAGIVYLPTERDPYGDVELSGAMEDILWG